MPVSSLTERVRAQAAENAAQEAAKPAAQREREDQEARHTFKEAWPRQCAWIVSEAAKDGVVLDPTTLDPITPVTPITLPIRTRMTNTRRRGAGRPRAQASRPSAASGDGSDDPPAPPAPRSPRPGARRGARA